MTKLNPIHLKKKNTYINLQNFSNFHVILVNPICRLVRDINKPIRSVLQNPFKPLAIFQTFKNLIWQNLTLKLIITHFNLVSHQGTR